MASPAVNYYQYSADHMLKDVTWSRAGVKQWWVLTDVSGTGPALECLVVGRLEQVVEGRTRC